MKKTIKLAFVVLFILTTGYNYYKSQSVMNNMSETILANVEALAGTETNINDCGNQCSTSYDTHFCCTLVINGKAFSLYYDYIPIG